MRLRKLGPAVLAATSLLALAPAAALAHRHPGPRLGHPGPRLGHPGPRLRHPGPRLGRCGIDIRLMPALVSAGETTEVSGQLSCHRHANPGAQTVQLYAYVVGTAGYVPVGSTTTEAGGAYRLTSPAENANTDFYVSSAGGARSGSRRLHVENQVTFSGPPEGTQIETGAPHLETFSGTVTPADVGARVILQRQNAVNGEEWHRIGSGEVVAGGPTGGTYTITHTFRVPGDASLRVLVRSDGLNAPSASTPLDYEISQTQNPSLTIVSSADPIDYQQQVTISGVLAGATTSQPVTLWARTVHQHGFAPVAEASTGEGGDYSFAAQTPVNSTLYRVSATAAAAGCSSASPHVRTCKARGLRGGLLKSAILYEGVRDVLTAEVSATTVEAGQTVEFKGTVAPDHAGHAIYLERENASGTGFHVVQRGYVLPGSVYSIVHQVYVPGAKVYRIDIPGDPENGRAVSQPFTVQVTPAPASALAPEAPGNSSLPAEGDTTGSETEKPLSGE